MRKLVMCLAFVWAGPGWSEEILVPAGTEITVRLMENVSSCCNVSNALVMLEVEETVRVDGRVVFPKGSPGVAVIRFSSRTQAHDQARERLGPRVELAPYSVTAVDGTAISLHATSMVMEDNAEYDAGEKSDNAFCAGFRCNFRQSTRAKHHHSHKENNYQFPKSNT